MTKIKSLDLMLILKFRGGDNADRRNRNIDY